MLTTIYHVSLDGLTPLERSYTMAVPHLLHEKAVVRPRK